MAQSKAVLAALRGEPVACPPCWFMRQAGRFLPEYRELRASVDGFLELCLTPDRAAEATLQPLRRFDVDAAILFADILIVPWALGQAVTFVDGEGPVLEPVVDARGVAVLDSTAARQRWVPVFETIERVRVALGAEKTLIGFAGSPWTVATYMVEGGASRDYAGVKGWAYRDPRGFSELIDILTENTIAYLQGQVGAGADVLQLFDTWAGVLPPQQRDAWVIEPTQRIVSALHRSWPNIPIIGFARGIGNGLARYSTACELDAVGLDTATDPKIARQTVPPAIALQGNLDPLLLVTGGPAMIDAARDIVAALGPSRFVFNLGHGILPITPPAHVAELVSALKSWRYA